jgi:hypothetical protein
VLILATDPDRAIRFPDSILRHTHGLAPAETEIANVRLTGFSLDEIAQLRQSPSPPFAATQDCHPAPGRTLPRTASGLARINIRKSSFCNKIFEMIVLDARKTLHFAHVVCASYRLYWFFNR